MAMARGALDQAKVQAERVLALAEEIEATGLNLPYYARNLRWTFNALRFDWGEIRFSNLTEKDRLVITGKKSLDISDL